MIAFDKLGNYKREAIYFNKSGFCYNKTDKKKKILRLAFAPLFQILISGESVTADRPIGRSLAYRH